MQAFPSELGICIPTRATETQPAEPREHPADQASSVHSGVWDPHAFLLDIQLTHFSEQGVFCSFVCMPESNLNSLCTPESHIGGAKYQGTENPGLSFQLEGRHLKKAGKFPSKNHP